MKKDNDSPFGSKERYFLSDIYYQGELIAQRVKSKLILSDIKYIKPTLFLYPPKEEHDEIKNYFDLEIKGYFEFVDGEKTGEVHIPKGYRISAGHRSLASSWDDCVIEIIPEELFRTHYLKRQEAIKKAYVVFSTTDNRMVRPWDSILQSFTGEVKIELNPTVILDLGSGWSARFEDRYRYLDKKIEEVKGTFTSSRLVLNLEKNEYRLESINEVKKIGELVDTLLWYLALASRQRTTWIEWTAEIGTELVEYCRDVSFPQEISEYKEPLVDRISIKEFLQRCLEYEKQENKLDLYLPLIYLVGAKENGKTIEMEFLSLFIALEALLDLYAENQNNNKVINDDNQWSAFYLYMKKSLENFPALDNKDQMIEKIGIFNQPSRKVIYNDFCKNIKVDNSDLWPVYGNNRDLSRIRNKLIHGKRFETWPILAIAIEHLRWVVERCLLAVLEWREKTEVFHEESLQKYTAYRDWRDYFENKTLFKDNKDY